jgi:hypothetical protein
MADGRSVAPTVLEFARQHNDTQSIIAQPGVGYRLRGVQMGSAIFDFHNSQ